MCRQLAAGRDRGFESRSLHRPACGVFLFGMQVQRFPDFSDFQSHKAGEGRITITRARYIITPTEDGNVSPETDTIENFTAN